MLFDISSPNSAFDCVLDFFGITGSEYTKEYYIDCGADNDLFLEKHNDKLEALRINEVDFLVLHVTSNDDECKTIKGQGIKNLQVVLSEDTPLNQYLMAHGLSFDIPNKCMTYNGSIYNIDYDSYRDDHYLDKTEKRVKEIGRKIYFDNQINGFFYSPDVKKYGTNIHRHPEFLLTLSNLATELSQIHNEWFEQSQGYLLRIIINFEKIEWFSFECYTNQRDFNYDSYNNWELLKKWMWSLAIDMANSQICLDKYVYMKRDTEIKPVQILEVVKISDDTD